MNIGTRQWLATGSALAAVGAIAAAVFWSAAEVNDATRQRQQTTAIAQGLTELRLVTFEYLLHREERARVQWHAVSERINRLIADNGFLGPEQKEIVAGLRQRKAAAQTMFEEFAAAPAAHRAGTPADAAGRRFEAQLLSRLLLDQQDSTADAFRLTELANQRIDTAQQRELLVIAAGLALVALITAAGAWLMHRGVLAPIVRLQRATQLVAAGNLEVRLDLAGDDEIGEMGRNFDRMVASLRDAFALSERKNRELAELNKELEAFSYSVSHDLRAPLRAMDGFSLVLLEDHGERLDAEARDNLQRIRGASQRMGQLIDDLLRLSQVTRAGLNLQSVDLSALARGIADTLQRSEPARAVRCEIEPGLRLEADAPLMRIAMQNLLENAWKFTGSTAQALIRVGMQERDRRRTFFVADNGAGFDLAHAGRLFEPFQRLHRASEFPGTGIGLAIVQRIVRRHGGRLWAEAKPGEGATFFFTVTDAQADARG